MAIKIKPGAGLGLAPTLTILVLLGPIAAGLIGTIIPAFGGMRFDGGGGVSLDPWRHMLAQPGIVQSAWLSLKTGLLSTFGALVCCLFLIAGWHGTRAFTRIERVLSPLLSVPHAAAALGLTFLIAPSGWLARLLSPGLTGWSRPPDILIVQDPGGWALIVGLMIKELPFLLLMALAALPQINAADRMKVTQALGYGKVRGWFLAVMPTLYTQIRLPIYAVLAYGMSNVDVSMVLGPTRPPTLSMFILRWMTDPDLALRAPAAAAALLQLGLVAAAIILWRGGERLVSMQIQSAVDSGTRGTGLGDPCTRYASLVFACLAGLAIFAGLLGQLIWSLAGRWRFPDTLPQDFGFSTWERHGPAVLELTAVTIGIAFATAFLALVLVLSCLEAETHRQRRMNKTGMLILYLPLILPQIAFLPGLQILLIQIGAAKGVIPVILTHLVFVLPYVYLALAGPYRALDSRFSTVAASLGGSPIAVLFRVRLPMLLAPVLTALAVGMAVSVGQYLATLLTSGGRINTLTTEALALFSGGDRRAIGVWMLALAAIAWIPFALALMIPRYVFRNRRGLRHG